MPVAERRRVLPSRVNVAGIARRDVSPAPIAKIKVTGTDHELATPAQSDIVREGDPVYIVAISFELTDSHV